MDHPHVIFQYDIDKDISNLKIGLAVARNGRNYESGIKRKMILRLCVKRRVCI